MLYAGAIVFFCFFYTFKTKSLSIKLIWIKGLLLLCLLNFRLNLLFCTWFCLHSRLSFFTIYSRGYFYLWLCWWHIYIL